MRLLFIIDPHASLVAKKDSTIALMRAAARRGDRVYSAEMGDLSIADGNVLVLAEQLEIFAEDSKEGAWMRVLEQGLHPSDFFDAVLMRKEPPVDEDFLMCTRLLAIVNQHTPVVNHPQALQAQNEKLSILDFPDLIAPTWVGASVTAADAFRQQHNKVVLKPLNAMGGQGIYISEATDLNFRSIFDLLSANGKQLIMAQAYLPAARAGDFRVFALNGRGLPWMLARIPRDDDHRGNMAAGGNAEARPLDSAAQKIVDVVAPVIAKRGIGFAGLDVIGGRLIEINITCPTGLREVQEQTGEDIATTVLTEITQSAQATD